VNFCNRLLDEGRLPRGKHQGQFRRLRLHRVGMDDLADNAPAPSTLTRDYQAFEMLHKRGQRAARRFLDAHFNDIGRRSSMHDELAIPELDVAV